MQPYYNITSTQRKVEYKSPSRHSQDELGEEIENSKNLNEEKKILKINPAK